LKSNKFESSVSLSPDSEKKTRLGKALRDNLKKRKLQARTKKIEEKVCGINKLIKE
jgi:hypothetical protein